MSEKSVVGWIVSVLAMAPMVLGAVMKLKGGAEVAQGFEHLSWPATLAFKLGLLEAVCAALYLIPSTSVLGAVLVTGYMGGAIATHMRIGEPVVMEAALGVLAWLGIFLKEPRLSDLLPVRSEDFKHEREIVINRPREQVFAYLKPLDNFRNWNPFLRHDPQTRIETRGRDGQVGYVTAWQGNGQVGSGEQEITRIVEGERVEFELRFKKPFAATNRAYFAAEPVDGSKTRVRWAMMGKTVFPMSVLCKIINMDKMMRREFDLGLSQLKTLLEK